MWGFGSTLSNVVNTILAKIEGKPMNQNVPNVNPGQNQMASNINVPQMNPNTMVISFLF